MTEERLPFCACCIVPDSENRDEIHLIDPIEIDWEDLGKQHGIEIESNTRKLEEKARISLLRVLEKRDPITHSHSWNLVRLWNALIRSNTLQDAGFNISQRDVNLIREGLLLHDIGKLAVPESILFKAGKPDPEELEVLRSHIAVRETVREIGINMRIILNIITRHHAPRFGEEKVDLIEAYLTVAKVMDIIEAMNSFLRTYQSSKKKVIWRRSEGKVWSIEHEIEFMCPENPELARAVLQFFHENWTKIGPRLVLHPNQLNPSAAERFEEIKKQNPPQPEFEKRGFYVELKDAS